MHKLIRLSLKYSTHYAEDLNLSSLCLPRRFHCIPLHYPSQLFIFLHFATRNSRSLSRALYAELFPQNGGSNRQPLNRDYTRQPSQSARPVFERHWDLSHEDFHRSRWNDRLAINLAGSRHTYGNAVIIGIRRSAGPVKINGPNTPRPRPCDTPENHSPLPPALSERWLHLLGYLLPISRYVHVPGPGRALAS